METCGNDTTSAVNRSAILGTDHPACRIPVSSLPAQVSHSVWGTVLGESGLGDVFKYARNEFFLVGFERRILSYRSQNSGHGGLARLECYSARPSSEFCMGGFSFAASKRAHPLSWHTGRGLGKVGWPNHDDGVAFGRIGNWIVRCPTVHEER